MTDKLVERLRTVTLYAAHGEASDLPDQAADALEAMDERDSLRARNRELEEALRPFEREAERVKDQTWDDDEGFVDWDQDTCAFTYGDLRCAKQVLGGGE